MVEIPIEIKKTAPKSKGKTERSAAASPEERVPIFIMGKKYEVPASLTIQKALEYAGYQLIRGCGCRGGICGACGTLYRYPDSYRIEVGLACQTVVQPNMYITQIPFFPGNKAVFNIGYHLIWCPKYRRHVLVNKIEKRLKYLLALKVVARDVNKHSHIQNHLPCR